MSNTLPDDDVDSLRVLFVSQDDAPARKDFANIVSLRIREEDNQQDIRAYARMQTSVICNRLDLAEERRKLIEDLITAKAEGTYHL